MDSVVFWLIKGKTPILFSSSSIKVLQVCDNCVPEGIVILGNSTAWSDLSCKEINGKQKKGLLCNAGNFYWCLTKPLVFLASMTAVSAGWLKTIKLGFHVHAVHHSRFQMRARAFMNPENVNKPKLPLSVVQKQQCFIRLQQNSSIDFPDDKRKGRKWWLERISLILLCLWFFPIHSELNNRIES